MAIVLITVCSGGLRYYQLNRLSLWLDEGFTVAYSRLPWPIVLGLHGAYDFHPPLYYSFVKLVAIVAPDVQAGRLISVVAGTLTIPVTYALAQRLIGTMSALVAAIALTFSPMHLWYSQEARPYVLVTLFVVLSYLTLVGYLQSANRAWLPGYSVVVLLVAYIDYASLFALAPQAVIIACVVYQQRQEAIPLLLALVGATILYIPWMPELWSSVGEAGTGRGWYLGVSMLRIRDVALALMGLNRSYFWSVRSAWDLWPGPGLLLLIGFLPALIGGLLTLRKCSWLAVGVTLGLLVGTVACAALVSVWSPAFAERTVLPAVVGWCLLLGAAAQARSPSWFRAAVTLSLLVLLAASLVTFRAAQQGDKQHWRDLAVDVDRVRDTGYPVITIPTITDTLLTLYAPDALGNDHVVVDDGSELPAEVLASPSGVSGLWLAYLETQTSARVREQLLAHGFERTVHIVHRDTLYLDLYLRSGEPP